MLGLIRILCQQMKAAQAELVQEHTARVAQLNGDIAQLQEQAAATRSAAEVLETGVLSLYVVDFLPFPVLGQFLVVCITTRRHVWHNCAFRLSRFPLLFLKLFLTW